MTRIGSAAQKMPGVFKVWGVDGGRRVVLVAARETKTSPRSTAAIFSLSPDDRTVRASFVVRVLTLSRSAACPAERGKFSPFLSTDGLPCGNCANLAAIIPRWLSFRWRRIKLIDTTNLYLAIIPESGANQMAGSANAGGCSKARRDAVLFSV